ncbi:MAG TPA: ABC transporter substrate-binding protein [Actinoplanes sp.]
MRKRAIAGGVFALLMAVTGCGGGGDEKETTSGAPSGEITVLTQRTDIVDTVFQEYKKTFEAKYPEVKVKFEALKDYEGEIRIRMNTKDYGDVLLISNSITADQFPTFFEPLGTTDELSQKYRFIRESEFDGKGYGLALGGNAFGLVYNKKVWQQAGVTVPPKSPEEFLTALQAIKDKTDAIPLYTNYKDAWPLTQWESFQGAMSADPEAAIKLTQDDAPWASGKDYYVIDNLLFDAVKAGLTEPDPTTTNWEASKGQLGSGKVATMALGSWAVQQFQEAAGANKADVGYMPFPAQVDGKFHSVIGGDYKNAINVNSEHKAAARAWVDWFANESGYPASQGSIPVKVGDELPATLADFKTFNVELFEMTPFPKGSEGLDLKIDKAAEVGIFDPAYRQRIIDSARGAKKETKEAIFADLNKKWAEGRSKVK